MLSNRTDLTELSKQTDALEQFVEAFDVPFAAVLEVAERMAHRRLESSVGLNKDEATALVETRGLDLSARLARDCGQTWTSEEVASRLGISRQAVHLRQHEGKLLAFSAPSGRGHRYPVWQFRGRTVRSWIPKVIEQLGNGFSAMHFLLVERKSLNSRRYLDLALSGDEEVIAKMLAAGRRAGGSE